MRWFDAQLDEIRGSKALIFYGIAMAMMHVLTFYAWNGGDPPARFVFASLNEDVVCWPIFGACRYLHVLSLNALTWVSRIYLLLGLIATVAFAARRIEFGYWVLLAATVVKLFFYAQDYRFGNEIQYLSLILNLVYLLIPGKIMALRLLLTLAYVFAGLAHLTPGWLSGDGLGATWAQVGVIKWAHAHGLWMPAAVAVVLTLSVISPALMLRRRGPFWAAFAVILGLHLCSRSILGDSGFYIGVVLTLIFPLVMIFDRAAPPLTLPALLAVSAFGLLQVLPWVTPGDHLLTGEGRLGAITLLDGGRSCQSVVLAHYDHRVLDLSRDNQAPPAWLGCDPYYTLRQLQRSCTDLKKSSDFHHLSWQMHSRRGQTRAFVPVVKLDDVCREDVRYSWLGLNSWIRR